MKVQTLGLGSKAPRFRLPGVDGKNHGLDDYGGRKAVAIIWSCNHCPYAQAYEDRIIEVQRDYAAKGVQIVMINSNETKNFPEDDFPNMVKRAKQKKFNFPYLRDEDQSIAKLYGPGRTPEVFLFDQDLVLRYHGGIDDNYENPAKVRRRYMREALDDLLAGKPVRTAESAAVGCSIKWL